MGDEAEVARLMSWMAEKATTEYVFSIRDDEEALTSYIQFCDVATEQLRGMVGMEEEAYNVTKMNGMASGYKLSLTMDVKTRGTIVEKRTATIEMGVADTYYVGTHDLKRFATRVNDLFAWHGEKGDEKSHIAPYFPIIQSSGMGKTKLLYEFKKQNKDKAVLLLLCTQEGDSYTNPSGGSIFDHVLQAPKAATNDARISFVKKLEDYAVKVADKTKKKEVVLLFDEAQHLLNNDGFPFRCIRGWLRTKIIGDQLSVAAVFAGTNSSLANIYDDPPEPTFSRESDISLYFTYKNKLFPPFFDLCTVGCLAGSLEIRQQVASLDVSDYRKAIPYGRPLFTLLAQDDNNNTAEARNDKTNQPESQNPLDQMQAAILERILLSAAATEWKEDKASLLSVLSTRVQMGQTSTLVVSRLVSKGYACLTDFTLRDDQTNERSEATHSLAAHGKDKDVAEFCHFSDPVCARLAMCLMDKNWKSGDYQGMPPLEWTQKAMDIFVSGMCRPNKGDLGEIGAALYLLFCGDRIRRLKGSSYEAFSVPFQEWFEILLAPHVERAQMEFSTEVDQVSFIQFRRLYFRLSFKEMLTQDFLMDLYTSGTACYLYEGCPVFDMVASVKSGQEYKPLLISVKARQKFSQASVDATYVLLKKAYKNAFHMLVLIGREEDVSYDYTDEGHEAEPTQAVTTNELLLVSVPSNDPFGVTDLVLKITSQKEKAEVYASHDYVKSVKVSRSCLRRSCRPTKELDEPLRFLEEIAETTEKITETSTEEIIGTRPLHKRRRTV